MTTYNNHFTQGPANCNESFNHRVYNQLKSWVQTIQLKNSLQQERKQLLSLSDAMLNDIGVSRADAKREAANSSIPLSRLKG